MNPDNMTAYKSLLLLFLQSENCHRQNSSHTMIAGLAQETGYTAGAVNQAIRRLFRSGLMQKNHLGRGHTRFIADLQLTWDGLLAANRLALDCALIEEPIRPEVELLGAPANWRTCLPPALTLAPPPKQQRRPKPKPAPKKRDRVKGSLASRKAAKEPASTKSEKDSKPKRRSSGPPPRPAGRHHDSRKQLGAVEVKREARYASRLLKYLRENGFVLANEGGLETKVGKIIKDIEDAPTAMQVVGLLRHMASDGKIVRRTRRGVTVGIAIPGYELDLDEKLTMPSGRIRKTRAGQRSDLEASDIPEEDPDLSIAI